MWSLLKKVLRLKSDRSKVRALEAPGVGDRRVAEEALRPAGLAASVVRAGSVEGLQDSRVGTGSRPDRKDF